MPRKHVLNRETGVARLVRGRAVRCGNRWLASLTDGTIAEVFLMGPHRNGGSAAGIVRSFETRSEDWYQASRDFDRPTGDPVTIQIGYQGEPAF